jgi:hypothetical protein
MTPREWIISHRCSWMAVYVFCRNAQSESHSDPHDIYVRCLYSINCPTVIYLLSMLLFILWRDTTSELWIPVQFSFTLLYCFTITRSVYIIAYYYSFTTRYAQSFVHSKPMRLTTSSKLGAKFLVVLCADSSLLLVKSYTPMLTSDVDVQQASLCVVIDQPVGNPKRKV